MKTPLSIILALVLTASAFAQEDENIRNNMWKLWQSTVAAPEAESEPEDSDQQGRDEPASEPNRSVPDASPAAPAESTGPTEATRAPAIQPVEPVREHLIPVQIAPGREPEQAQADSPDQASDPASKPGPPPVAPDEQPETQPDSPTRPERPDPTSTSPPVRLAGTDESSQTSSDPADDASGDDQGQGELPTGLEQFKTPPALIAALKLAQVSSADKVKDPAGLADRLYTRNLRRPAEYFYRAALVRQKDIDRAWVLLQLGNCLQDHDVAAAGEQYATVLAEFPDSPWATMAKVQQEICRYRLRHRDDTLTGDVLREVHEGTTDQLDELLKDLVKEDQP
jgi:hypothetical protein